ncbi:uncharacterized protein LOC144141537 [Haemaphysalis longicornis]
MASVFSATAMKARIPETPSRRSTAILLAISGALTAARASSDDQRMAWCGGRLNPRDFGTATKTATDLLLACKDEIIKLNASPRIIREVKRLCIVARICYAYAGKNNTTAEQRNLLLHCLEKTFTTVNAISPELLPKYGVTVPKMMNLFRSCAKAYLPREEKYALATIGYLNNFISG